MAASTMKQVEISGPGGPEVLNLVDGPLPDPGTGEVLIKVYAAGVNRPDVFSVRVNTILLRAPHLFLDLKLPERSSNLGLALPNSAWETVYARLSRVEVMPNFVLLLSPRYFPYRLV